MSKMSLELCGINLKNPVIAASGTYNFGEEYKEYYDISRLGGISVKGLTLEPREGNDAPRIAETYGGILNSVGLQNPGVEHFVEKDLPNLLKEDTVIIANIAGNTKEEYCMMAKKISDTDVDMIELNISCPNVKAGGLAFGACPDSVEEITRAVKKYCSKPLIVKLTPNTADIVAIAKAAERGGADCLSLINTLTGMAVDIKSRKPILANVIGGLSGPAIKPIALRMVWQVYNNVSIPIIGIGGIMNSENVIEFLLCGATAVQVGTANIVNPYVMVDIIEGLEKYLKQNNIKDIRELIGALEL